MKKKILYLICIMLLTAVSVCAEDSVLPSFKLDDINGKPRTLESIRGDSSNPVIVNFWATWCSPCKKEMPELQNLLKKFGKDKLSIIAISVDKPEKISGAKSYVKSKKFEFTFLFDPEQGGKIPDSCCESPVGILDVAFSEILVFDLRIISSRYIGVGFEIIAWFEDIESSSNSKISHHELERHPVFE